MADRHDYVALEWLKGEIAETLRQARHALDEFIEDPANGAAMAECLNLVHQVHGSLQMIEFYGAALLAEEIEQLALAVQQNRVSHPVESEQLLIQAMSQLPLYLERIHSARRDLPLVVLPLLNDLRSARVKACSRKPACSPRNWSSSQPLMRKNWRDAIPRNCQACCASCARPCRQRWRA